MYKPNYTKEVDILIMKIMAYIPPVNKATKDQVKQLVAKILN